MRHRRWHDDWLLSAHRPLITLLQTLHISLLLLHFLVDSFSLWCHGLGSTHHSYPFSRFGWLGAQNHELFFPYFFQRLILLSSSCVSWDGQLGTPGWPLRLCVCVCTGEMDLFFLKTKNKYWKLEVERCLLRHSFVLVEVIVTTVNNRWPYAEGWENILRDDLFSFFRSELKGKKRMGSWGAIL